MAQLPIETALPKLHKALAEHDEAILSAPPGAGKTTYVPFMLLQQHWCTGKILMFEPRRMAARNAAQRMASEFGEDVGKTVGYRVKGDTCVSAQTRIEVVTGGVLSRMLVDDPSLEGVSLLILDEFHERNIDADASLALALAGRSLFREPDNPLKLLVMSATLDTGAIQQLLTRAPLIETEGRMFAVDTRYCGQTNQQQLAEAAASATVKAAAEQCGDILVFLPGQREIRQVQSLLQAQLPGSTLICPLYGALPLAEQQKAISPIAPDQPFDRKVVLATDIAETSLTINGVTIVVDAGFHRAASFDPRTAMMRLQTRRISRASATQRAGRAGRTAPGVCYRLWAKEQVLEAHTAPEITRADLAPLALTLSAFGIESPAELQWLTPPPEGAYRNALALLSQCEAVTEHNMITAHGQRLVRIAAHPRLAHMLCRAAEYGLGEQAAAIAAVLGDDTRAVKSDNLQQLLDQQRHSPAVVQQRKQFLKQLANLKLKQRHSIESQEDTPGLLLALAYPDRLARQSKDDPFVYLLANGRRARIHTASHLQKNEWLAVAELGGVHGKSEDTIYLAAPLNPALLQTSLSHLCRAEQISEWDTQQERFVAAEVTRLGAIELSRKALKSLSPEARAAAIAHYVADQNLEPLNWDKAANQLLARIQLVRGPAKDPALKHIDFDYLKANTALWLQPALSKASTKADLQKLNVAELIKNILPWSAQTELNALAPERFTVPSGSNIAVDYTQNPPVLAVKLQEMFGCQITPSVCNGDVPLMIHLLSPAGRPLQVTQDLTHFWQTGYTEVKKEMKGRYPKHPWPDNPLEATATRFTKKRMGKA